MANNKSTTIELNGKLYDATTGVMVGGQSAPAAPAPTASTPPKTATNIDGFISPSSGASPSATPVNVSAPSASTDVQPTRPSVQRPAQSPVLPHQPQKTQALMRSAVTRPQITSDEPEPTPSPVAPAEPAAQSASVVVSPNNLRQARLDRANQVPQSSSISKFSFDATSSVSKKSDNLPVQPHPDDLAGQATEQAQQAVSAAQDSTSTASATSAGVFATQLENATSHEQPAVKAPTKTGKKAAKLAAAGLIVVAMAGMVVYHNIPGVSVKLASTRAGFAAAMPGYTPSGFSLSDSIKSAPGQVVLNYISNSDSRNYQLTQQPSDWNSQSLLDNFVKPTNQPYQTQFSAGKTVYTYGKAQATWVSNGVWYQIKGDSSLSSTQLLHIIDSL